MTLVGATISNANYPGQTPAQAMQTFNGLVSGGGTSRPMANKIAKIYYKQATWSNGKLDAVTAAYIAAGTQLIVCVFPDLNMTTADFNNLATELAFLQANGAVIDSVVLKQEPNDGSNFANAAAYQAYVAFYYPAVQAAGCLSAYNPGSGSPVNPPESYYPGDQYVQKIYQDYYGGAFGTGPGPKKPLDACALLADNHSGGPIPFGLGEWNAQAVATDQYNWLDYTNYIIGFFSLRQAAGRVTGNLVFWSGFQGPSIPNDQVLTSSDFKIQQIQAIYDTFTTTTGGGGQSAPFTEQQAGGTITGAAGQLPLAFTQSGGQGSQTGSLVVARMQTSDGSMTITPPSGWQLIIDTASGGGTGAARSLIYGYPNNPGSLGTLPGMGGATGYKHRVAAGRYIVCGTPFGNVTAKGRYYPLRRHMPVAVPTVGSFQTFTYTTNNAAIKGDLAEYTTPPGTIQHIDQHGMATAVTAANTFPVTCSAPGGPNTEAGGLAVAVASANFSVATAGAAWAPVPPGWTVDRTASNAINVFWHGFQTGIAGTPSTVSPTYNNDANMTAWAAAIATFYATPTSPVTIVANTLPGGSTGVAYSASMQGSGGATPYSWAVSAGSLPPGITLASSGVFSGTPTTIGSYTFTITVTDAAFQTATASRTIVIAAPITVTTTSVPSGQVAVPYSATLAASGGTPPYTWAVTAGSLPAGLSLSSGGIISGTPTNAATYSFTVTATDSATLSGSAVMSITVAPVPPVPPPPPTVPYDSLTIGRMIQLLGNRAVSALPQCPGAQFMLAPGYDINAPQPTVDVVASMLLNGERPYGRRFSNRTITLPIVIAAPTRAILAAARETLLETINQDTWELAWTRSNAQPLIFDCFRALPTVVTYSTKNEKLGTPVCQLSISFQALPFGRSDALQTLLFPNALAGGSPPPAPVLIDDFTTVNSTSQHTWWTQSTTTAIDNFSAWWHWASTDEESAPTYTRTLPASVNISGQTALSFWLGLGTQTYNNWHKGRVAFAVTLTDASNNTISPATTVKCHASNSTASPTWNQITVRLPASTVFDFTHLASYSIKMWSTTDIDGGLELDSDVYLNGLYAIPSVVGTNPPSSRGIVYQLNALAGTAPAPLALQLQQASTPNLQQLVINTAGPFTFIPPAGVTSVRVQKWGGGGGGAAMTTTGLGGGAKAGEYSENPAYLCTPGVEINGFVGAGGGVTAGGFVQRVATGALTSDTATVFKGNVTSVTTGGQTLLVQIGFGTTGGTVTSVADTAGNTYVKDYAAPVATTNGRCLEVWRCATALSLNLQDIITVTLSTPQNNGGGFICDEYAPLGNPDVTNFAPSSNPGNQVSNISPTATMLADDGVAVAAACVFSTDEGTAVNSPFTASGPHIDGGNSTHGLELLAAYKVSPGAGSLTAKFTWQQQHTAVGVILGYPVVATGSVNGQDTWFGADDTTAAHGGLGVATNSSTGATAGTGISTDAIVFAAGNGASGTTTGGGGGESGGPLAAGHNGGDPLGGTGTANAGDGGPGAAAGGNHPGGAGLSPGGAGGGAVSIGGSVPGGPGAAGQVILSWSGTLTPFRTAIIHVPSLDAPALLSPLVDVGDGNDVPDGNTVYPVVSPVAGQNARFGGTYTVLLVNNTWDNPNTSRSIFATVNQYEYPGGPVSSVSTPTLELIPSNPPGPNTGGASSLPGADPNGLVVLGEVTLPVRDMADDQTTAYYTITVTDTDTNDRFLDVLFLDTQGQTIIVSITSGAGYCNYYLDVADANNDLGHLLGSTFDRSQAISVMDSAIWSGGPISIQPGLNNVLTYAVEGQPSLQAIYAPCWYIDRLI